MSTENYLSISNPNPFYKKKEPILYDTVLSELYFQVLGRIHFYDKSKFS